MFATLEILRNKDLFKYYYNDDVDHNYQIYSFLTNYLLKCILVIVIAQSLT